MLPRELRLDADEAEKIAAAQMELAKELGLTVSPRMQAIAGYGAVVFGTMAPKFQSLRARKAEERRAQRTSDMPIPPTGRPPNQPWNGGGMFRRRPPEPPPANPGEAAVQSAGIDPRAGVLVTGAPDGGKIVYN